ncbi:hypothetical protein BV133_298 [Blastochloris viridis]|uniref:Uncharacterized protein n=2 Tax=Blastochloris viridis TaxID=1079 RepID=A0A182CZ46_BLAVI|nr:hypothetical protein BV133_298 [Blastochloris viridis]
MLTNIPSSAKFIFGFAATFYIILYISYNIEGTFILGIMKYRPPESDYKFVADSLISAMSAFVIIAITNSIASNHPTSTFCQNISKLHNNKFLRNIMIFGSFISLLFAVFHFNLSLSCDLMKYKSTCGIRWQSKSSFQTFQSPLSCDLMKYKSTCDIK